MTLQGPMICQSCGIVAKR